MNVEDVVRRIEVDELVVELEDGGISRRTFLHKLGLLGLTASGAAALLATSEAAAGVRRTTGLDLSAGGNGTPLARIRALTYSGPFFKDPKYQGANAGGWIGKMNAGSFPKTSVPWKKIQASKPWVLSYSIFNSAWPLPVAYAERSTLDGGCMGVKVLQYKNEADPAKGLLNAQLMVEQGVQFAINLQLFPDVNDKIAKLFKKHGIKQLYYAVPPKTTKEPFMTLPDYSTGYTLGVWLGNYAKKNWGGKVDLVLEAGQKNAGPIPQQRMYGGLAGIESVLGKIPKDKVAYIDTGNGTLQEAQAAAADYFTSNPSAKYILLPGYDDVKSVGVIRALEAAGRDKYAAASGLPGTPEGIAELRKGPGKSAFKVSALQDLAFGSWPVAVGIYALEGGKLPDVGSLEAIIVTADNVGKIPSQTNTGYSCKA